MSVVSLGPVVFSSGWNPQLIEGPSDEPYVVEHRVPNRVGGHIEYVGKRLSNYQIIGFIAPNGNLNESQAVALVSGGGLMTRNADQAKDFLLGMRGSGVHVLNVESTLELSGNRLMYEADLFAIMSETFVFEPGHSYPYYPFTIDLKRANYNTYGNSSGNSDWVNGLSGFIRSWRLPFPSAPKEETINALGFYAGEIFSGAGQAKLAVYNSADALQAQTASQIVHSGWNYFPIHPSFAATSGHDFKLAMKGNNISGLLFGFWINFSAGDAATSGREEFMSGVVYSDAFPATYTPSASVSGQTLRIVMAGI